jgi:hypothetical protein
VARPAPPPAAPAAAPPPPELPLTPEESARLEAEVAVIEDPELRAMMLALGTKAARRAKAASDGRRGGA